MLLADAASVGHMVAEPNHNQAPVTCRGLRIAGACATIWLAVVLRRSRRRTTKLRPTHLLATVLHRELRRETVQRNSDVLARDRLGSGLRGCSNASALVRPDQVHGCRSTKGEAETSRCHRWV